MGLKPKLRKAPCWNETNFGFLLNEQVEHVQGRLGYLSPVGGWVGTLYMDPPEQTYRHD